MEVTPYTPPRAELKVEVGDPRRRGRWIAAMGVVLFTGPIWGMLGTVIGMVRAFNRLAEQEGASADALAQDISSATVSAGIGISVGLLGATLILMALLAAKNRERWFFIDSVVLAVLWCLAIFPYGLIVGLPIAILFITRRGEFRKTIEP